jgi:hypothetical protein
MGKFWVTVHGRFDHQAKARSAQLWLHLHRRWLLPTALGASAALFSLLRAALRV